MKKALNFWVRMSARSPLVLHLIVPALVAGVIRGSLWGLGLRPDSPQSEAMLDIFIVAAAYIVFRWAETWGLGPMLRSIRKIAALTLGPHREVTLSFATHNIDEVHRILSGLVSPEGIELEAPALDLWIRHCFDFAKGYKYDGVDSNIPSIFLSRYGQYLEMHSASNPFDRINTDSADTRTLIARPTSVTDDLLANRRAYEDFFYWHEKHGVKLSWVDPGEAQKLQKKYNLPCTDIGLWHNRYALLFKVMDSGNVRLWMRFAGDEGFQHCISYVQEICKSASNLERHRGPGQVSRELAEAWEDYVAPLDRLNDLGPFLLKILGGYQNGLILDGAAGIGCDSVFLIENGFSVTSNEIDPNLSMMAMQYARARAGKVVNLDLQECYWQSLIETMPGRRRFDAVIVLGNSICLVMDEVQRLEVLNQFFGILKQGGKLIIDERNFPYMLESRDEIMKDRFRNFSCSWKVMYCGETVRACPWIIDDKKVIWRVYRNKPPVRNDADIESALIDDLPLYPFKMGELTEMLSKVGFDQIETHSDFLPGIDKTCDFFTHVARKP